MAVMDQNVMIAAGTAIGAVLGAMAAFLTAWVKGRADLARVVDERLKMAMDRDGETIVLQRSEIEALRDELSVLRHEHQQCNARIEALREEIAVLRSRVQDISEPEPT